MARLFNAYIVVRWNAASKATSAADSVWIGVLKRDVRFRFAFEALKPPTRAETEKLLVGILEERIKRRERTLLVVDFPLGLPRGLAAALKLPGPAPWRAVWDQVAKMVKDRPDNSNNRFGVGSEINRRLTGGPFPFWGCPARDTLTTLKPKRGRPHGPGDIPEFRHVEIAARTANPVWKLYFSGSVGGQTLLGIPMLRRLKMRFGEAMRVWPFETGYKAITEAHLEGAEIVALEADLTVAKPQPQPGEVKEAAQARALAEHLARLDEAGALGVLFAPAKGASADVILDAEAEEGWTLGVESGGRS